MPQFSLGKHYLTNLSRYLRHDDFLSGDVEDVKKYLVRHMSEYSTSPVTTPGGAKSTIGQVAWNVRLERLANKNLCEPIMLQWLAFLSQEVSREKLDGEPWETIWSDVDGMGTPTDIFIRWLHWHYLAYGRVGCLIEGPSEISENQSDAIIRGERSYAQIFEPWLILDAKRFTDMGPHRGKLKEVLLLVDSEDESEGRRNMIVRRLWIENQGESYRSQLYTVKGHILDDIDGTSGSAVKHITWGKPLDFEPLTEEVYGSLDEIPFVLLGEGPKEDSIIFTAVSANREHLNKKSAKDTIDYYQAFQRVAFFGVSGDEAKQWSENIAAFFSDPNGRVDVIESGDPASLTDDIEKLERDAVLDGLLRIAQKQQLMTKQVQSAESKREDNATFEEYLGHVVDMIEEAINRVYYFLHRFERATDTPEFKISIGKDFKIAFTTEELVERNLLVSLLRDFGQPGRKATAAIACTSLLEQRIAAIANGISEDELKQQLVEELWNEAQKEPQAPRFRDLVGLGTSRSIADGLTGEQQDA